MYLRQGVGQDTVAIGVGHVAGAHLLAVVVVGPAAHLVAERVAERRRRLAGVRVAEAGLQRAGSIRKFATIFFLHIRITSATFRLPIMGSADRSTDSKAEHPPTATPRRGNENLQIQRNHRSRVLLDIHARSFGKDHRKPHARPR